MKIRIPWFKRHNAELPVDEIGSFPISVFLDEHFKPWLEKELEPQIRQMIRIREQNQAMQFVMDMLVMAHPNPAMLLRVWRQLQPEMADELVNQPPPPGQEAFKQDVLDARQDIIQHYNKLLEFLSSAKGKAH